MVVNIDTLLLIVVDVATFKLTAKNPECRTTNIPYLKVVGIKSLCR